MRDLDDTDAEGAAPPPSIAIVGMAGRYPKSPDLQAFWTISWRGATASPA